MQLTDPNEGPRWKPLERNERRALGVLVEKAKTTPSAYPLTLNAIRTGSNQKSNRFPMMELEEHHLEDALEGLRKVGAVTQIQGDGRTEKFRHHAYDWLGVDKVELAVMAELLLRGAQTLGELRGRAGRMEPIKGQAELQPVVDALVERGLVIYLTRPGRGAIVTHNLYQPQELDKVKADAGVAAGAAPAGIASPAPSSQSPPRPAAPAPVPQPTQPGFREAPPVAGAAGDDGLRDEIRSLREELSETRVKLQTEIEELRSEIADLRQQVMG